MCGRFALFASENEIISHFRLTYGFSMRARFNIAPTQVIPVITKYQGQIEFLRWGFVPAWEKPHPEIPKGYINAKVESISDKPTFKQSFLSKRCLIPASGYYEWRTLAQQKQPYFVSFKEIALFAFAGIWSNWQDERGQHHATCAILTQEAPEILHTLHPRAPVVISPEHYSTWLMAKPLLTSPLNLCPIFQAQNVIIKAVSRRMSLPSFEGPECILAL